VRSGVDMRHARDSAHADLTDRYLLCMRRMAPATHVLRHGRLHRKLARHIEPPVAVAVIAACATTKQLSDHNDESLQPGTAPIPTQRERPRQREILVNPRQF
jgi:hypothetical protein